MKISGKLIVVACILLVLAESFNAQEVKKKKKKSKKSKKKNVQSDAAAPAERPQAQQPDYPLYPDNYDYAEYEDSDGNIAEGRTIFNVKCYEKCATSF